MKKWKLLLGMIALSLGLVFTFNNSTNVNAASWHRGTPIALRGHWKQKTYISDGNSKTVYYNKISITQKMVEADYFGSMPDEFTHIRWRKLNHNTYLLHARRFIDGYNHKIHKLTIRRTSRNRMYLHLDGHSYLSNRHKEFIKY
ncbi:hypothetical protein LASUN_10340 [Lentilactobacillus sunkii]|jgi:hypothetical protein|uniref:Lipocalin-like domain-containing protein n=1 Tax=Lentilactobacillus sunkii TaxID=481719 RepID=A0A1E7XE76_9LACO|nr:hypothetical protein [Lentilactobacillus sunkii]OFA11425.1 hypothetical protein LASUN_10340 [Lentilactobacillus sunkii]